MEAHGIWQTIIVDWDAGQYATIEAPNGETRWDREVSTEKEKGRDIHCFRHDLGDTSGLSRWARQHHLTQTKIDTIMPTV